MVRELDIILFLERSVRIPVADVRTPAEHSRGHIPGAVNLPLFSDEERKIVGTLYKQQGREKSIEEGIRLVQNRLYDYTTSAKKIAPGNEILLHCWRGGLRSSSMAWLLDLAGLSTAVLKGGYKAYRGHVLMVFDRPLRLITLGGLTGSGKTEILKHLKASGQQVIDLEALARHKGSAFGSIGLPEQPTNEQFENDLASCILALDPAKPTWVEDESRNIGKNMIPAGLFSQMRSGPVVYMRKPAEERAARLAAEYSRCGPGALEASARRIEKRLGGLRTRQAIECIRSRDYRMAATIFLSYYDKTYAYGLSRRDQDKILPFDPVHDDPGAICSELTSLARKAQLLSP